MLGGRTISQEEISLKASTKILLSLYKNETLISFLFYLSCLSFPPFVYFNWQFFWSHWLYLLGAVILAVILFVLGASFPPKGWVTGTLQQQISRDLLEYSTMQGEIPSLSRLMNLFQIDRTLASNIKSTIRINYDIEKELEELNRTAKAILEIANQFGGILSLSKAFLELDHPLNKLKATFAYLEQQGIVKELEQNIYNFHGMREFSQEDQTILKFAEERGGEFNIEEIMKDLSWPRKKIEMTMKELAQKGVALKEVKVGTIKWYFPGLIRKKGTIEMGEKTWKEEREAITSFQENKMAENILHVIDKASKEILITTHILTNPLIDGNEKLFDLLKKKAGENVDITILLGNYPSERVQKQLRDIESARIFLCPRMHATSLSVDSKNGLLLTGNLTDIESGLFPSERRAFEVVTPIPPPPLINDIEKLIQGDYCTKETCQNLAQETCDGIKRLL